MVAFFFPSFNGNGPTLVQGILMPFFSLQIQPSSMTVLGIQVLLCYCFGFWFLDIPFSFLGYAFA